MSDAYVGIKPCGYMVAAFVDKPEYRRDIARETSRWIRDGLTVQHVSAEEVRQRLKSCKCAPVQEPLFRAVEKTR